MLRQEEIAVLMVIVKHVQVLVALGVAKIKHVVKEKLTAQA
jgi:hypothetical protein